MEYYEVIEDALLYIEDHLQESLSLESVSKNFHMSKYYFHRLFSAIVGCSLNQYVQIRKLNAAAQVIQKQNVSLTDIAYQLNFGSPSSFTRAFKKQYGVSPSTVRKNEKSIPFRSIPQVIKRSIKNINGDIVTDFTLIYFEEIQLNGFVLEVDLAENSFKDKIRAHSKLLVKNFDTTISSSCYVIYSNCQPNSTKFKVLVGVPKNDRSDLSNPITVNIPSFFSARFKYSGDLLDIGDVLIADFARFLKISKQEAEDSGIELIQIFEDIHNLDQQYEIAVPIKKLPIDSEC